MATRTMIYFILFVLRPWIIFIREQGNSERILDVLVVVKLAITSTSKKVSQAYKCSLRESDAQAFSFLGVGLLLSFHRPRQVVHQL